MLKNRKPWQEELEMIDRTMMAISGVTEPEKLVDIYWNGIGDWIAVDDYLALSRRNVEPPYYLITRSSRFTEHYNPWTQREMLPKMTGGLLGEIAYGNKPFIIEDLPARLQADDPAHFYLEGFQSLVSLPLYDNNESVNTTVLLLPPGADINYSMIPILHWQSSLFGRGTHNLVLRNQLATTLAELDRELQTVGAIQRSLLPRELPPIAGFDIAADYQTSARAGGDYYDFFPLADGGWGLFIADVSGHGTPAAVLMAITHAIAHSQPGTHTPPAALLRYLNRQLCSAYTSEGNFVTAFYAVLDPKTRTLTYATAGHNPPRLVHERRVQSLDQNGGLPLGVDSDEAYREATVQLSAGDLLLLYTDGVTETMSGDDANPGELFGTERLDRVLLECAGGGAKTCIERIRAELSAFCHCATPVDDQTLIAIGCG